MTFFENPIYILPRQDRDEFDILSQYSSDDEKDYIPNTDLTDIKSKIQKLVKSNSSPYRPPNFITKKRMNRGRKIDDNNCKMKGDNKCKRKTHTSNFIDNTLCKLQIHFLNFLVNFSNDAIRTAFGKEQKYRKDNTSLKFKKIEHGIKRDIKTGTLENLMQNSISYVLKKKISNKYRKLSRNPDYNEQIYNQVIKKSEWLKNLLDMNYLDLFEKYYNQCNPIDSIYFEGKTIYLAKETKPFYNLYNKLNLEMKDKIIKIIKDLYIGKNKSSLKFIESTESK